MSAATARAAPPLTLADDPTLQAVLKDALAHRPELAEARAEVAAAHARAPLSRVLPDPTISLGIQNDGFGSIQVGKMETSWLYLVAAQTLPWFGKRDLREALATSEAKQDATALTRAELTLRAELTRAYLDLLLAREQLNLLARTEGLWLQSEGIARARYEAGDGAQSDLLRAQLERVRLKQRRLAAEAEETRRREVLNSLRGSPFDAEVPATLPLPSLGDPTVPDLDAALAAAQAESPELQRAALSVEEAETSRALAHKETLPDITVLAGVMPRGNLEPMWQAGVSFPLPVWSQARRTHLVNESTHRREAAEASRESLHRLLVQRVRERIRLLDAAVASDQLYRQGILIQSEATMTSTLAQYRVGRVGFSAVLEAVAAYVSDVDGFLQSLVAAHKLAIGLAEVSLQEPTASPGVEDRAMPGGGGATAPTSRPAGPSAGAPSSSGAARPAGMGTM